MYTFVLFELTYKQFFCFINIAAWIFLWVFCYRSQKTVQLKINLCMQVRKVNTRVAMWNFVRLVKDMNRCSALEEVNGLGLTYDWLDKVYWQLCCLWCKSDSIFYIRILEIWFNYSLGPNYKTWDSVRW